MKTLNTIRTNLRWEDPTDRMEKFRIYFIALIPVMTLSTVFFGLNSLRLLIVGGLTALATGFFFRWGNKPDFSPAFSRWDLIPGLLIALTLPAGVSLWFVALAAVLATLCSNLKFVSSAGMTFLAVLLVRSLLQLIFPTQMESWTAIITSMDAFTGATPLGIWKSGIPETKGVTALAKTGIYPGNLDLFWGNISGSLGEISSIAILIGGLYLIARRSIAWRIPVTAITTVLILQGILWLINPIHFLSPVAHLFSGGLFLGLFYFAADQEMAPASYRHQLAMGSAMGMITLLLRNFGPQPEGIGWAILLTYALLHLALLWPMVRKVR
ncbi:MAG: RnfABCDGE type electron transport complex subunit D [Marinilabiliales bacterium]|nr:RnfABCDGE type electron transport complex subunit D [Marinilabiliales bacterium]